MEKCPKEIISCSNKSCKDKLQRERLSEHREIDCLFEVVKCNNECGCKVLRGNLGEHIYGICPLVQSDCPYRARGCSSTPMRGELVEHMKICLYQPSLLKCSHQVNMKDIEEHSQNCGEYPMECEECGNIFTRGQLAHHKCLPFLLSRISLQEVKMRVLEGVIEEQKYAMALLEENYMKEIRRIEGLIPVQCKMCKLMKKANSYRRCGQCQNEICIDCISSEIDIIGEICEGCNTQALNNKLQLIPIFASSTHNSNTELDNILIPGNNLQNEFKTPNRI